MKSQGSDKLKLEMTNDFNRGFAIDTKKKIKVLYIDYTIGFGGATKSLSLVLRGLQLVEKVILTSQEKNIVNKWYKGYKIYKFRRIANYKNKDLITTFIKKSIPIVLVQKLVLRFVAIVDLLISFINIGRIVWIVKSNGINLIHINTDYVLEGILAGLILKIPCIAHFRGFFSRTEKIAFSIIKHISHMICVSMAVSDSVHVEISNHDKVTIIYDPVDIELFDFFLDKREIIRNCWDLKATDIVVGIFGRIIPWKGQLEFVRGITDAIKVNKNIRAIIVGDESDGRSVYFKKIKSIIKASEYKEYFIFAGYQSDVEAYYISCDIIVHASIEPEPFGMVIPEGMSARKPIIATAAGGPLEILTPGLDGILITPGNIEEMTVAILELANDPIKRQIMGLNGYNKVKEKFNIQSIAYEVESLYKKLLNIKDTQ
jgi:glycosyltransferase involved in cell wall biosynthesis